MELVEDGENTILRYVAKAETGGKLAQLGGRLITSTAKKLSKMFFEKFEKVMSGEVELEKPPDRLETVPATCARFRWPTAVGVFCGEEGAC